MPWRQDPTERRISQFEAEVHDSIGDHWSTELMGIGPQIGLLFWDERTAEGIAVPAINESVNRLLSRHQPDELGWLASEMYFNPGLWRARYLGDTHGRAMGLILHSCVQRFPPQDVASLIEARLRRLLQHPCGHEEERFSHNMKERTNEPEPYFRPRLAECIDLLLKIPPTSPTLALARRLVAGDFDFSSVSSKNYMLRDLPHGRLYEVLFSLGVPSPVPPGWITDGSDSARSYEVRAQTLALHFPSLMELLYNGGLFDENLFISATRHIPQLVREASRRFFAYLISPHYGRRLNPGFLRVCASVVDEVAWRLCRDMKDEDVEYLTKLEHLRGSRFLLRAAALHQESGLEHVVYQRPWNYEYDSAKMVAKINLPQKLEDLIVHLACVELEQMTAEERTLLVEQLRKVPRKTLEDLLPLAAHSRDLICEALDWRTAMPIIEEILRVGRIQGDIPSHVEELRSSADASCGVVDVLPLRAAMEQAGEDLTKRVLKLFRQAGLSLGPILMLIEAVAGSNREGIEERIRKRNQPAVRAYGLLPVLRGEEEVMERYLFYRVFSAGSKKFGMLRQGNEKAATMAGLENLARNAGYGDATRLEWAMEARLGGSYESGKTWTIAGYEVRLTLDGGEPMVAIIKENRALKSVPEPVKKSPEYAEVKEAVKRLRNQRSRIRHSLEDLEAQGEFLRRAEVERLTRLPTARDAITSLVWGTEDGRFGLIDGDGKELILLDGSREKMPEHLFLAHSYHLFRAGTLSDWQREVVHRRIEQPFKQVFRELYVVTPAEQETRIFSNRFAGRLLNSGVASRLFQARGWKADPGDIAVPYKVFAKSGLKAVFDFPDAGHILAETESVTSDRICFERHPSSSRTWAAEGDWVPLADVPPLVFSEVMRDADLVVSVAQREETILSDEAFQRRGEVVKALLEDLGLPGVTIEGHHAKVKGKLASYRVHLGTAHIFIEPGNYLCVVPARWGMKHEKLFLPFADEGDKKFSEVISKILFLVNDDKIKDESILKQIRQGGIGRVPLHG